MTKVEFSDALVKLLTENDINVNDAMHVLTAQASVLAISICPPDEARKRLHIFIDSVFDDAVVAAAALERS